MTGAELVSVIAALGALFSSLAALMTALASYARLGAVHDAVNGQGEALRTVAHSQGFAAGFIEGARPIDPG